MTIRRRRCGSAGLAPTDALSIYLRPGIPTSMLPEIRFASHTSGDACTATHVAPAAQATWLPWTLLPELPPSSTTPAARTPAI